MASSLVEYSAAISDVESGYVSGSSSEESLAEVYFTKPHLRYLNKQLKHLEPQEVLKWAILSIPNLFQTTAFGLTGLVAIDMLSKLSSSSPIDLIFFDTLHHFNETLELVEKIQARYPHITLHIFKPQGANTEEEFAAKYGTNLWEFDDERYDWLAKVEPAQRAYAKLNVKAALTGRRRSQGGKRGDLDIIEIDDAGLIKINPLANWSFAQVQAYIKENDVPYNALLDMGYKSVGDWHSTQPVADGEDERAGRWKGKAKTECGIHNSRSRYALFLMEQEQKKQREELEKILSGVEPAEVDVLAVEEQMAEVPVVEVLVVEATVVQEQQLEAQTIEAPVDSAQQIDIKAEELPTETQSFETSAKPAEPAQVDSREAVPSSEHEAGAIQTPQQQSVEVLSEAQENAQQTEVESQAELQSIEAPLHQSISQIQKVNSVLIDVQPAIQPLSS